jgi:hypothetical protein
MREIEARTVARYPQDLAGFATETVERKCTLIKTFAEPADGRLWLAAKAVTDEMSRYGVRR